MIRTLPCVGVLSDFLTILRSTCRTEGVQVPKQEIRKRSHLGAWRPELSRLPAEIHLEEEPRGGEPDRYEEAPMANVEYVILRPFD